MTHKLHDHVMLDADPQMLGTIEAVYEGGTRFGVAWRTSDDTVMGYSADQLLPLADDEIYVRLARIADEIALTMDCVLDYGREAPPEGGGKWFVQIRCWRKDVITGEMGWGRGGKGYIDERMSDGQIVQMIFGLFMGYWTHEAREGFTWRGRRIFGPHTKIEALWEAAGHVDIPSAMHVGDR